MSNWTHVAGIIRIDDIRFGDTTLDFDKLIGKECLWDSSEDCWMDTHEHPEDYLPMGSEGSLEKSVWINPDKSCMAAYTISIFGDLRDHDDPNAIVEWFKKKVKSLPVRQAVITVYNEWNGGVNWYYMGDDDNENDND